MTEKSAADEPSQLPKKNHVVDIATKSVDVLIHPLDCFLPIHQPSVQILFPSACALGNPNIFKR